MELKADTLQRESEIEREHGRAHKLWLSTLITQHWLSVKYNEIQLQ